MTSNTAIELHHHSTTLRDIPNGEKVVFCLRDPVSRFVSAFNHRLRKGQPRKYLPWTAREAEAFQQFPTPNQLGLALSADSTAIKQQAELAMQRILHVNTSYWQWFENEDYFTPRIDDVLLLGFQETLAQDFEQLKHLIKLPNRLQLPTHARDTNKAPDTADRYLEPEAIRNLQTWYARDYDFIQLCKHLLPSHTEMQ